MTGAPSRRDVLGWLMAGSATGALGLIAACDSAPAGAATYPVRHSEAEWRRLLGAKRFHILREAGTEPPFSSPLNDEHRKGTFVCAADGQPLFASSTKFDSGTGWPSFFRPLKGAVTTRKDWKLGYPRDEVLCTRCGGHLGHVFDDGPAPTGLRYCMNGLALNFRPG